MLICEQCGRGFEPRSSMRKYVKVGTQLCSTVCLRLYVESLPPVPPDQHIGVRENLRLPNLNGETYYSALLGASFRSEYEGLASEVMVLRWGWRDLCYEPHIVRLEGVKRRIYIPDFCRMDSGVWIEVKGEWRSGAKKKFVTAHRQLNGRIVLMGPQCYSDIRRESAILRRRF